MKNTIKFLALAIVMCIVVATKAQQGPTPTGHGTLSFDTSMYIKEKNGYFDIWKKPSGELVYSRFRVWGNGICQEPSKAVNYKNKSDYIAFMLYGTPLQKNDGRLYDGLSYSEYMKYLPIMQQRHNESLIAFYNALNSAVGGKLAATYNLEMFSTIEDVVKVFESSRVYYTNTPTGEEIYFDGVDITNNKIFPLPRKAHTLGGSGEAEGGWWIDLSDFGYEPMFSGSAYCFNTPSTSWIAGHLKKLPTSEEKPAQTTPKAVVFDCPKKAVVIPCNTNGRVSDKAVVINGNQGQEVKNAVVLSNNPTSAVLLQQSNINNSGPKSSDYDF